MTQTTRHSDTVSRLLTAIQEGHYPIGSALPSERELAATFDISRNTLREAIRTLANAGVVEIRPRSGTVVLPGASSRNVALRARAEASGDHSPLDLIVARLALEPVCAEYAADHRSEEDLRSLAEALHKQEAAVTRGEDPSEPDVMFHSAIAAATHNPALAILQSQLAQMMHGSLWNELKGHAREAASANEKYLDHHRLIYDAIADQDSRRAGHLMTSHLADIESALRAEAYRGLD
ncbi:FadR/GntR family transcriptional regulator [Nesterenkonia rhizosphaerae]|uniref:FadR/GntR family transcriptional regulator n=1 Tax=Nesterenkonia rhizosphaerae TaxID=1348272 RepID=A0ABP9FUS2_9MICC